jgi:hypothetical protein
MRLPPVDQGGTRRPKMPSTLTEPHTLVLLSERRRRILLRVLQESMAPLTIDALAARVRERESVGPSRNDRREVRISLQRSHLPQLREADVILYDENEGIIEPGPNFHSLVQTLETTTERELPWSDV